MEEKPRFFVTGSTGFIGRALCRALRSEGFPVRGLARAGSSTEDLEKIGVEIVTGALEEPGAWKDRLAGCDCIVHLAGDPTFGNGAHYDAVNFHATQALRDHAAALSPRPRIVFVSSQGAVDRASRDACSDPLDETDVPAPTTDYGRSKLRAEACVAEYAGDWVVVRPSMVAGRGMRPESHVAKFAEDAILRRPLSRIALPGRVSVVHVDDLVRAIILVSGSAKANRKVFFASGEPAALRDIFKWAGASGPRLSGSLFLPAAKALARAGLLPFPAKVLLLDALVCDDGALRSLGWAPVRSARDTVEEVAGEARARLDASLAPEGWTIVTGAASGLGLAMARLLEKKGRKLLLVDRNAEALAQAFGRAAGDAKLRLLACDLESDAGMDELLRSEAWSAGVDELILCAGRGLRGPSYLLDGAAQEGMFRLNVGARLRIFRHAAPSMMRRRFGRVVFISSSSAFQPLPYMAAYAASNAALLSFGEAAWAEMRSSGVRVLTVCPGGMATGFQKAAGVRVLPKEKLASPEEVAETVFRSLARGGPTLMVGFRSFAMSLFARAMPRAWNVLLWAKLMRGMR